MAFDDSCFCRKSAHSVAILAQVASSPQAARPALCLLSVLAAQLWLTMVFGKLTAAGAAAAAVLHHKHEKEEGKEGKGGNATANYDVTGTTYCDGASHIGWPDGLVHRDHCHGTGDGDIAPAINLGGEHCVAA